VPKAVSTVNDVAEAIATMVLVTPPTVIVPPTRGALVAGAAPIAKAKAVPLPVTVVVLEHETVPAPATAAVRANAIMLFLYNLVTVTSVKFELESYIKSFRQVEPLIVYSTLVNVEPV
jgi:hypothetical protein